MNSLTRSRARISTGAGVVLAMAVTFAGAGHAAQPPAGDHDWLEAIETRSDALNRQQGLGDPEWKRALRVRSEALNRLYGLG